jgi:hypothetical protein
MRPIVDPHRIATSTGYGAPMRTRRQRMTTAAVVLVVMAAGGGLIVAAWTAAFPGDPDIDCARYEFPTRQWRTALRAWPSDEPLTRRLARNVVRCPLVLGRTPRDVRALLGPPLNPEFDRRGRNGWLDYAVGSNNSDDVYLYVEFRGGRAIYVSAPDRDRNGRGSDISAGTPTPR